MIYDERMLHYIVSGRSQGLRRSLSVGIQIIWNVTDNFTNVKAYMTCMRFILWNRNKVNLNTTIIGEKHVKQKIGLLNQRLP